MDHDETEYLSFHQVLSPNDNGPLIVNVDGDIDQRFKWRIGIDIRSIGDFSSSLNVRCKYQYLLFDGGRWFESNPPIEVMENEEKALNDGFCAYEILRTANDLVRDLSDYPLIIEFVAMNTDNNGSDSDIELGIFTKED